MYVCMALASRLPSAISSSFAIVGCRMLALVVSGLALVVPQLGLEPRIRRTAISALRELPLRMSDEDGECTIIGEESSPGGKVWFACDEGTAANALTECTEEEFGTGGGLGILPDDGQQVLCKAPKVSSEAFDPPPDLPEAADEDGGECVIIGEEADGGVWYVCSEDASIPGADCSVEEFGTGGGVGILPQDGEKLCKAPPVTAGATSSSSSSSASSTASAKPNAWRARHDGKA